MHGAMVVVGMRGWGGVDPEWRGEEHRGGGAGSVQHGTN